MNFDHITKWRLLSGSHDFPGPDGGTCINEAAIIAAGFEYKKVGSADDCPPCFSRPISTFAIYLNDKMPGEMRQRLLMPFVFRLAGSADTQEIESKRAEFILIGLIRDVVSIPLRGWKDDLAAQFEAVQTLEQAQQACESLAHALARAHALAHAHDLARALAHAHALARARALDRALDLARAHAHAHALDLARDLDLDQKIFEAMVSLLDGALKIGKQTDPLDGAIVDQRLTAAKAMATA